MLIRQENRIRNSAMIKINCTSKVKIAGEVSDPTEILFGVRQGKWLNSAIVGHSFEKNSQRTG